MARNMVDELRHIEGVGRVQLFGAERAMRIWVDPDKLISYGLTMADLSTAISQRECPHCARRYRPRLRCAVSAVTVPLTDSGAAHCVDEVFEHCSRPERNGSRVVLGDVARVELGAAAYGFDIREKWQERDRRGRAAGAGCQPR